MRLFSFLFVLVFPLLVACAPVRQPVPVGEIPRPKVLTPTEEQYGHEVLGQLTEKFQLDYSDKRLVKVEEIVDHLTTAAGASADPWHVYLFKDPTFINAAATRGNHVFVWSGILDHVRNDNELAVILAHEISHVLAGHTDPDPNEEIKRVLIQVGAMAAGIAVSQATHSPNFGQTAGDLTSSVTESIGNGLLVNPYARELEYEADQIGLFLMADAGYDPEAAVDFWTHVQGSPDFGADASFLSTHPSSSDRLDRIRQMLPAAKLRFEQSKGGRFTPPSQQVRDPQPATYASRDPLPTGPDTFDISQSPARQSYVRWRVTAPQAILREKPARKSRALGEFRNGAIIDVVGSRGAWLEVYNPDHGYIERSTVALESPSRQ